MVETMMEKQVSALNNTFISLFRGSMLNSGITSSSAIFGGYQIYKGEDHLTTTCPKLNEPWPKCAKCGLSYQTENCEIKCTLCSDLGHSKYRCWKEPKERTLHFG